MMGMRMRLRHPSILALFTRVWSSRLDGATVVAVTGWRSCLADMPRGGGRSGLEFVLLREGPGVMIGRYDIQFKNWGKAGSERSFGRFGGGWSYKFGIACSKNTLLIDLLFGSIRVDVREKS